MEVQEVSMELQEESVQYVALVQCVAPVRTCKPPEVYKGKGIMYVEVIKKRKEISLNSLQTF